MKFLVLLFLAFFSITVNAQNIIVDGDIFTGIKYDKNYVVNAEGEKSHKVGITSTMSTTSRTAVVADVISGQYSYELTAGAASQSFTVSSTALAAGLNGKTCEGSFDYRFNSLSIPFVANILSGTTVIASGTLTNTTGSTSATVRNVLTYPCVTGLKPSVQVTSTASSATKLYTDKYYTGAYVTSGGGITGVVTVAQGGTSLTTTVNNGLLVGSGTTQYRTLSPTASGAVVTLDENGNTNFLYPETNSVVNYLANPSFEQSATGWVVSGAATVDRYDRSLQSVNYLKSDRYYGVIVAGPLNTGACYTQVIPQSQRGSNIEISTKYRNGTNVSGTWVMQSTVGSQTVSQSLVMEAGTSTTPYTDQFLDSPTMVIGTTSSTSTVQTCFTRSVGPSVYFHFDNVWVGAQKSLVNGAIVGPEQSYTPTFTGLGAPTGVDFKWSQFGNKMYIRGKFVYGTTTSTPNQISLPAGYTIDSNIGGANVLGMGQRNTAAGTDFGTTPVLGFAGNNYISLARATSTATGLSVANGNDLANSGTVQEFYAFVPIQGWSGTGVSYDGRCPNDMSCENNFSATISDTGVIAATSMAGWLTSCTNASPTVCQFATGLFVGSVPTCVGVYAGTGASTALNVSANTTQVQSQISGGAKAYWTLFCQKNGSDFVAKKTIQGYLSQTVSTSGQTLEYTVRARFGGAATETTVCSSTPCTIYRQSGGISSITRSATGQYQIVFPSGTFSAPPNCFFTVGNGTDVLTVIETVATPPTSTTFNFNPNTTATTVAKDVYGSVACTGPR